MAMNWLVSPNERTVCELGMMDSDCNDCETLATVTINVAEPVTTPPAGLVAMAVMVVVPWLNAVTRPALFTVAIFESLELQVDWPVRSTVVPGFPA